MWYPGCGIEWCLAEFNVSKEVLRIWLGRGFKINELSKCGQILI